jgi:hypothetical protein
VTAKNHLILTRRAGKSGAPADFRDEKPDPVRLELFNNLFMAVAEQCGTVLRNTAQSVNIKERLDFSCAIFDAEGGLIANAPHVPVHLVTRLRSTTPMRGAPICRISRSSPRCLTRGGAKSGSLWLAVAIMLILAV